MLQASWYGLRSCSEDALFFLFSFALRQPLNAFSFSRPFLRHFRLISEHPFCLCFGFKWHGLLYHWAVSCPNLAVAFPFVLGLSFFNGLPLHITRIVFTAASQRDNVIYDVSRPAVRMYGHFKKIKSCFLRSAVCINGNTKQDN